MPFPFSLPHPHTSPAPSRVVSDDRERQDCYAKTTFDSKATGMSNVPELMRDQYGFPPTQDSDTQRPQQGYYRNNQSMLPYPSQAQQQQQASMNLGPANRTQHVRPRRRAHRPQLQPEPSTEPGLRAALGPAAATMRYPPGRRPRVPAPAITEQLAPTHFAPTHLRTQQPPNQQYAPLFAQQYQRMYIPTLGRICRRSPAAWRCRSRAMPGSLQRSSSRCRCLWGRRRCFGGSSRRKVEEAIESRSSEQLSVGGSDVGRGSSAGEVSFFPLFPALCHFRPPRD